MLVAKPVNTKDNRTLPASLDDLKEQLRIEHNEQDRLLLSKIMTATIEAEQYLGCPIIDRLLVVSMESWEFGDTAPIRLPTTNAATISSVDYYDANDVAQTLNPASYELLRYAGPFPVLTPVPFEDGWPTVNEKPGAIEIQYLAGFGTEPSDIPSPIQEAVLLRAATRYANPEEAGLGTVMWSMPDDMAFKSLLTPFRGMGV